MATLLVALYVVEGIVRIPTTNHMALQFRAGAPNLLERLAIRQQEKGDVEVALLSSHTDFFAPKLLEPILTKYPSFHLISDVQGGAGHYVLEKHWREIAMQKNVQHSLRMFVAGPRKGVARVWNSRETVCVEPFLAYDKKERARQRAELKAAGKKPAEDFTMRNLGLLIDDALSAPQTPICDVLKTSAWVKSAYFPLMGDTFVCVAE